MPYCFARSSITFQGHRGQKIADFDLNWAFPDCNSCLNSPTDLKWNLCMSFCKWNFSYSLIICMDTHVLYRGFHLSRRPSNSTPVIGLVDAYRQLSLKKTFSTSCVIVVHETTFLRVSMSLFTSDRRVSTYSKYWSGKNSHGRGYPF